MKINNLHTNTLPDIRFRIDDHFLLYNETAKRLYHEVAKMLPVIDPHNHVDAAALASGKQSKNLYQLWVKPDMYKHRAMRNLGIAEYLITGDAPEYEKYCAWAECLQHTTGNPLYHWSCMELKELFGIQEVLTPENAKQVWDRANTYLLNDEFRALDIVQRFNVEMLCTSDDLLDSLEHHIALGRKQDAVSCLPSLRGDSIIAFHQPDFFDWLQKLQSITGIQVADLNTYQDSLINRLNFFDNAGCLLSDHSLDTGFRFIPAPFAVAEKLFERLLHDTSLAGPEYIRLQSYLLHFLGMEYARRKWKMQLHIGANRFTSTRLRKAAGAAGGYASIGNTADIPSLCLFLDGLDVEEQLPKTILYTLNPADNAAFASLTGSFSQDGVRGKIQFGPAWWMNDHHEGITQQLVTLASYGLLSTSIGMTTDSRSVLSFIRHGYFRRILCNLLGTWAEEGKIPDDWNSLSTLVAAISYYNIKNWIKK